VVGSEVPQNRPADHRFAVMSIQKRLPKVLGPLIGGFVMAVGYWLNLSLAFGLVILACLVQFYSSQSHEAQDHVKPVAVVRSSETSRRI